MKIKTTTILKTLKGDALIGENNAPLTIGEALGNIMVSHETGGKMKCFILGQKFATNDEVEIDEADFNLVKKALENTRVYISLVSGQILINLEGLSEK